MRSRARYPTGSLYCRELRLPRRQRRDLVPPSYRGCTEYLWLGSWTCCHLYRLFRSAPRLGGLALMAQSYLGKRAISKGIGRVIRKFVVFDFNVPLLDIGSVRATRTPGDTA